MGQFFSLLIGYIIGAVIQTSYWYGKKRNMDIRRYGSGNAGTTNAMRTMGRKAGIITAVGDVAKVFLSALISWAIFRGTGMPAMLIFLYSGLGTVLGHCFPFYMGFRGGKGVATTAGVIISLFFLPYHCWVMTLLGVLTFFGVLIVTRYASLASLCLVTEFLIEIIIWGAFGNTLLSGSTLAQGICLVIIITAVTYLKHRGNIERLLNGTERKFGEKVRIPGGTESRRKSSGTPDGPERGNGQTYRRGYDDDRRRTGREEEIYDEDGYDEDYGFEEGYEEETRDGSEKEYRERTVRRNPERDEEPEGLNDPEEYSGPERQWERNIPGREMNSSYDSRRRTAGYGQTDNDADEFVRNVREDEMPDKSDPNYGREFIWDAEKNRYVRYRDYEFKD